LSFGGWFKRVLPNHRFSRSGNSPPSHRPIRNRHRRQFPICPRPRRFGSQASAGLKPGATHHVAPPFRAARAGGVLAAYPRNSTVTPLPPVWLTRRARRNRAFRFTTFTCSPLVLVLE